MKRLEAFGRELKARKLDRFIVSNISNVRYLSGFSGSTASMLVTPEEATLVTDFRYQEQAEGEVFRGIKVHVDKLGALVAVAEMIAEVGGRTGFESGSLTYALYEKTKAKLASELVPVEGVIEELRSAKDADEIASLERAQQIADTVFAEIIGEIAPGLTEIDIAARIDFLLRKKSSEVPAFKTIVASGEQSSKPHAHPTSRVLRAGDPVTMDFGAIWDGYCSDITRTVVVGKASDKLKEVYATVLEGQERAIAGIRAGMTCRDADNLARELITRKGYGDMFGHGLGHGLGIEVHESPRLSPKSEDTLKAGMVATVEPGVYIPGWGGVRIEDVVVVEEDGCRVLTKADKRLLELGD